MNDENLRPPWQPGESGNPKGRPRKSAAEKLREQMIADLLEDYMVRGKEMIAGLSPSQYYKAVTALLPKELSVEHSGSVAHEHRAISETAGFLEEALGVGTVGALPESVSH